MVKQSKKTSESQRSCIYSHPTHALADLIKCKYCNGAMVQIGGKGGRYYGCYNATRKSCNNKLLIPKKRLEAIILYDLKKKFLTIKNLKYIYETAERAIYLAYTSIQILALLDEESRRRTNSKRVCYLC